MLSFFLKIMFCFFSLPFTWFSIMKKLFMNKIIFQMLTKNLKKNWKGSYKDTTQNSIGNDLLVCKKKSKLVLRRRPQKLTKKIEILILNLQKRWWSILGYDLQWFATKSYLVLQFCGFNMSQSKRNRDDNDSKDHFRIFIKISVNDWWMKRCIN